MSDDWVRTLARDISTIRATLAAQHVTLQEHTRRSLANEEAVADLRKEISPLKTHVAVWGAAGKIIAAAGTLVAIARAIGWF